MSRRFLKEIVFTASSPSSFPFGQAFPFQDDTSKSSFDKEADSMLENWSTAVDHATTSAAGLAILNLIVFLVIAFAIIYCLKRAGKAVLTTYLDHGYQKIQSTDLTTIVTDNHIAAAPESSTYITVPDRSVKTGTMERFFSNMARERPVRYSPQELEIFTQNYNTRLGSGGYGDVYKGEFPDRTKIAVKVFKGRLGKGVEEQLKAEVSTMGRTNHVNLVKLYGFCFDEMKIALVYEYMENGSLDKFLFNDYRTIEWATLQKIALGTAKGIAYLHEECQPRIIHYDIKPENVLLDPDFNPKVADFGLAKLCTRDRSQMTNEGFKGTVGYAGPELWGHFPITHKCDVYSFGMLLFEIVRRRRNRDVEQSGDESEEWFPKRVWTACKNGELGSLIDLCGIKEDDRDNAKRMAMVALWCAQRRPEARPLMSVVVQMLEGTVEVTMPPYRIPLITASGPVVGNATADDGIESLTDSSNTAVTDGTACLVDSEFVAPTDGNATISVLNPETAAEGFAGVADWNRVDVCPSASTTSKAGIELAELA